MKVDFQSGEQVFSSQVITWKLEISRDEWEGDEVNDICFHSDSKSRLPGNDFECQDPFYWNCCICDKNFNVINRLFLCRVNDKKGKVFGFQTTMTKERAKKLETMVDIKVKAKSETLKSISLRKIADDDKGDGDVSRLIHQDEDYDELTFHEGPIEIEATFNIVKKETNLTLVPTDFVKDIKNIGNIFETSDVEVLCNGKAFPCHKNVLCARSPVLARYLLGNSKEREEGEIDIQDSSVETVELMLEYVYQGELGDIPSVLDLELLKLADRYELMCLKDICGESLLRNLSPENYLVTYAEIDTHFQGESKEAFKKKSEMFFKENAKAIVRNKAWIQFAKNFPELNQELVILGLGSD